MKLIRCLACVLALAAQKPDFDIDSRVVLIPTTVTDKKGRVIDNLSPSDFSLLDNGLPQKASVDSIATGVAPIALVIAVQSSGISAAALVKIRKIASMIQPLVIGQRGCAAVVAFAERVEWLQDCTNDQAALDRAFASLEPGEPMAARMIDAVYEATQRLRRRQNTRRVLLLVSESRDRGSETDLQSAVLAAEAAGVSIYPVTYSAFRTAFTAKPSDVERRPEPKGAPTPAKDPQSPRARDRIVPPPEQRVDLMAGLGELIRLGKINDAQVFASKTGGIVLEFHRQKGLENAIEKLGAELHAQYLLSFTPESPKPGFHSIEVRLNRKGEFRIRSRPSYWAPR